MNLLDWAERLQRVDAPADIVDLHVKDTLTALLLGMRTQEGRILAQFYGTRGDMASPAGGAAIARLSECDDIHLASCVTPGATVVPVVLSLVERRDERFNRAVAAGYAAGIRLGLAIGGTKALAQGVWPTLLAAPLMAAVAASIARGHKQKMLAHAMALSLSGAGGRLGRVSGTGRWFVFAEALAKGVHASDAALQDMEGDLSLLSREWLAAQAGHEHVDPSAFESSGSISDTGFKPFPIARQGANAVAAFQALLERGLDPHGIESIDVFVPQMNLALLTRPVSNDDRLSRLCNMGFQLACAALAEDTLYDAERLPMPALTEFAKRVRVSASPEFDSHVPDRWPARLVVKAGGKSYEETVIRAPFDADAPDLDKRVHDKWRRLLAPRENKEWDGMVQGSFTTDFWQWLQNAGLL